ncbi:MAG: tetratricopeptide repeat protein [Bacteroidia bacterium]|nr:tetratricopeptide repeat protein [Bacteroidia bacterium]
MIKYLFYIILLLTAQMHGKAQQAYIDSLIQETNISKNDTARFTGYIKITEAYTETNPDSALLYAEKALKITQKLKLRLDEANTLGKIGYAYVNKGNYPRSLQTLLNAITVAEDPASEKNILPEKYPPPDEFTDRHSSAYIQRINNLSRIHQYMGILYSNMDNHENALYHYLKARQLAEETQNISLLSIINNTLGRLYLATNKKDSALITAKQSYDQALETGYKRYLGSTLFNLGRIYAAMGNNQLAAEYFEKAIEESENQNYLRGVAAGNLALADLYRQSKIKDSIFIHINNALLVSQYLNAPDLLLRSYTALTYYYKDADNNDSAVKYQSLIIKINDSLFNSKQAQQFQNIDFDEQQRQQQIEEAKSAYRNKLRMNILLAGVGIFLLIAIILWRNNNHKQKAYALLKKQKQETDKQKAKVEHTLAELESTQAQLIQSEKMASLGELTAGIAHEIQNPLNFVNNFSEVNSELIGEMKEALDKGDTEEAKKIADDIISNEQKIIFHGKRADTIVKGMLQHSRSSSGTKEPTDINSLADEYLRLAYHGLRAKDKSFNATMKTDYDETIGNINIIPQDIGRVILNLITNAFYVVDEKKNASAGSAGQPYEPTVSVSTKKIGDKVLISVKDNGNGIPQKVLDKIFQPFFTTKPTGQGTGLGLSLSYDIIKAHGGEIKVETKENYGTEFMIILNT